nr:hypothetical protein [Tanacetum cinerariifolium]
MSTPKFSETHNLVAFLEKPTESEGFEQIIDFLNANTIKYALTVNPTIYTSCIKQFLAKTKVKTNNGEQHIQALVDKKNVIITETSVRSDIHLEDVEGMLKHKEIYVTPSHTKKIFANMKRQRKDVSGKVTPLFETMMKYKSKKSKKRITEVPQLSDFTYDMADEHVTTTSNDPLLSDLDADEGVALIDETQGRSDQDMFDTSILDDEKVVAGAEKEVSTADLVPTASEVVTNVDYKLAARLQEEERGGLTIEEKSSLFVELMDERKKYFARLGAKEIRKLVKSSEKASEGSSKRATSNLEQEDAKRQRIEEENESAELKR